MAVSEGGQLIPEQSTAAIVVHRSRAGCEAELAGGLPALGESPCRAWYLQNKGPAKR